MGPRARQFGRWPAATVEMARPRTCACRRPLPGPCRPRRRRPWLPVKGFASEQAAVLHSLCAAACWELMRLLTRYAQSVTVQDLILLLSYSVSAKAA